jgi:hypothetical protein
MGNPVQRASAKQFLKRFELTKVVERLELATA